MAVKKYISKNNTSVEIVDIVEIVEMTTNHMHRNGVKHNSMHEKKQERAKEKEKEQEKMESVASQENIIGQDSNNINEHSTQVYDVKYGVIEWKKLCFHLVLALIVMLISEFMPNAILYCIVHSLWHIIAIHIVLQMCTRPPSMYCRHGANNYNQPPL